jgi:membrane protein
MAGNGLRCKQKMNRALKPRAAGPCSFALSPRSLRRHHESPPQQVFLKKHTPLRGVEQALAHLIRRRSQRLPESTIRKRNVALVSNPGTLPAEAVDPTPAEETPPCSPVGPSRAAGVPEPPVLPSNSKWYRWRSDGKALVLYLLDSEVHTFAFSVAANAILSFIPFIVLLYTLARSVFRSPAMVTVIGDMVRYFLPSNQDWVAANLAAAAPRHGVQVFSLVMILVSCTGIFLPLEVALNQAWGVPKSRNFLLNQAVAFGLALLMVALALAGILVNTGEQNLVSFLLFHHTDNFLFKAIGYSWLAVSSGVASILFFFSIYWILPNCKVPARPVLRASIFTGILWLAAKYLYVAILPYLDLKSIYGPFYVSVGLLFWAYVSGLILFAGAQFSVSRLGRNGRH